MKRIVLIFFLQLFSCLTYCLNVTIIESQFIHTGQDMDSVWYKVALKMGHPPNIVPYSTLKDIINFSTADILIISSGEVGLFAMEVNTIYQFLKSGRPVYLQSEHLPHLTSNQAFAYIVKSLGGSFEWQNLFSGYLKMNILGSFSHNTNVVNSVDSFWYSVSGVGDCNMINFLEKGGEYHGFQFIPPNLSFGSIITTSDQDWVQDRFSLPLMENIITHLISPPHIPENNKLNLGNDTILCQKEQLILDVSSLDGNYLWHDNSTMPIFNVTEKGIYWVTVDLECGTVSDTLVVKNENCSCHVYTPNIFSPNDDSVNDHFTIQSNCYFSKFYLLVFNRWGELVFESYDETDYWDGTIQGDLSPSGVYAFLIDYTIDGEQPLQKHGNITLIR